MLKNMPLPHETYSFRNIATKVKAKLEKEKDKKKEKQKDMI